MEKSIVKIKRIDPRAVIPTYGTEYSAGADLYACIDMEISIAPGETVMIPTGLSMEIPEGYAGLVCARSGLASKKGLAPANKIGVIDSDYRGEVIVALYHHGRHAVTVSPGERVAQLLITPVMTCEFIEAESLGGTERGSGGFGSTGRT
jgi:dUTP pyrophosphatase